MKLLKRYKSRIGSWLIFSFILQVTSPLIAAAQLPENRPVRHVVSDPSVAQQESLIIDSTVNTVITRMVEESAKAGAQSGLSQATKKCYKKIMKGQDALPALDVWEAMPDMLRFAVATKAARPTAVTQSPVVGPGNCEVTNLLAVINTIKNSIGTVSDTTCCKTILGILGDAKNILGVNISCALEDLIPEIIFTESVILEKLNELENTLTTCCANIRNEIEDISDQLADCCDAIQSDIFDSTTTILEAIDDVAIKSATCCSDVINHIEDIDDQVAECCNAIRNDIADSTITILEALSDVQESTSACCALLEGNLVDLGDQLEDCCAAIVEALDDVIISATVCCADVSERIEEISEELADCCNATSDNLDVLRTTVTACCSELDGAIDDIADQLEECCDAIAVDIFNSETTIIAVIDDITETLTACCQAIQDALHGVVCQVCPPIGLNQSDVVGGTITLPLPSAGTTKNYKFCEDITADLIISETGISVDMNDRALFGTITISGDNVIVKNGFVHQVNPPIMSRGPAATDVVTILDNVFNVRLLNVTVTSADQVAVDESNSGLSSLNGIRNDGLQTFIVGCVIQTGAGANGGDAMPAGSVEAGLGGNSGVGIISQGHKAQIIRTLVTTGNAGNGGSTDFGDVLGNAGNAGSSGTGISISGDQSFVNECQVLTGQGGQGGVSCCGNGGFGGNSGDAIFNESQSAQIKNSTARTGDAGNGGTGGNGADLGGNGGSSGNGIHTQGTQVVNNVVSTGNAGNGANAGQGGLGGDAGYGLYVDNACETEVRVLVVERTGNGGRGGNSVAPMVDGGQGGNGGDAVHITSGANHTEVRNSTFSNTGEGGQGGTSILAAPGSNGFPGRAVTDLNNDLCSLDPSCTTTLAPSAIFSNFAYAIGDTQVRYLLNGKLGESGKASNRSCNRLDNVYVDCDVNEVLDICALIAEIQDTATTCCRQTGTDCCDALRQGIDNLDEQIAECCETIIEDISTAETQILDKISTLSIAGNCCDCDFFITQLPTGAANNHPVGTPITVPGIYCLAESVTGTLHIESSNVTILFRGHSLTPDQITGQGIYLLGDVNAPFTNIRIEGGTIENGIGFPPFYIQNCMGLKVANMFFAGSTNFVSSQLQFATVSNFVIQSCQFTGNSVGGLILDGCSNGKIAQCQIRDFIDFTSNYISLSNSQQVIIDDIVITNNSASSLQAGVLGTSIRDCIFRNIRITYNSYQDSFTGISIAGGDNNIVEQCLIDTNTVKTPSGSAGSFVGIAVDGTVVGFMSNNNSIRDCQINENSLIGTDSTTRSLGTKATRSLSDTSVFVGIKIGENSQNDSCQNTIIEDCAINNNIVTGEFDGVTNAKTLFVGIDVASILGTGPTIINTNIGGNTAIRRCTINSNSSSLHLVGVNLAGIILNAVDDPEPAIIGANTCQNCVVEQVAVNNNSLTGNNNARSLAGFNVGSVWIGQGVIQDNCCTGCSFTQCTVNNSIFDPIDPSIAQFFAGFHLASIAVAGTIGQNVGSNCSIAQSTVNNNTWNEETTTFIGIGIAGASSSGIAEIGNSAGSQCAIDGCAVQGNGTESTGARRETLYGINLAGGICNRNAQLTIYDNACSSCSIKNSVVNDNTLVNGIFVGINAASVYLDNHGIVDIGTGVCDSCIVNACAVNTNILTNVDAVNTHFYGINLGGNALISVLSEGLVAVDNRSCSNCVISHSMVNDNQHFTNVDAPIANFFGVNFGGSSDTVARSGDSCNNCFLEDVRVCKNTLQTNNGDSLMRGFNLGVDQQTGTNLCNNITAVSCAVENNIFAGNGSPAAGTFNGFYATGEGMDEAGDHVCDNLTLSLCRVSGNTAPDNSNGYSFASTSTVIYCVNNLQLEGCVAQQNSNSNGFFLKRITSAVINQGASIGHPGYGFLLRNVVDSAIQNSSALQNISAGYSLQSLNTGGPLPTADEITKNVTILRSIAFGNEANGFELDATTTLCQLRDNVAQNNLVGFSNSSSQDASLFLHNFAQGNATNYNNINPALIADIAELESNPSPNPFSNIST